MPVTAQSLTVKGFFAPGGVLARTHPNYEFRVGQLNMARAVEASLQSGEHLMVEAGTGTGKTLAYLVPALLSGKRVIVSTGTKNLQEQLFFKDVAFLQTLSEQNLRVTYMKGRGNYLCRQKLYDAEIQPVLTGAEEVREYAAIRDWEQTTKTGDRSELRILPDDSTLWPKLDARTERCSGERCPQFDRCFITEMRRRAQESDLIIVNHHLFFADLALRDAHGNLLPDYDAVVFDEAHEIEDIAGQYFGFSVSNLQIQQLVRDVADASRQRMFSSPELDRSLLHLNESALQFFSVFEGPEGRQTFSDRDAFLQSCGNLYGELMFALNAVSARLEVESGVVEAVIPLVRRIRLLDGALRFWVEGNGPEFVYWSERRGRGVYLQAIPIDVAQPLATRLFEPVKCVILTSATLTVASSFEYAQSRLGVGDVQTLQVESQYDYARQALLYVPRHLPDPRDSEYTERAADELLAILRASQGRAFALFTSVAQMRKFHGLLAPLLEYPVLLQGDASRNALLELFRETPHAILFATSSFWQGVDVQGEQLSCVVIDRLPFAVPTDPVVSARSASIRSRGGDPFSQYQIPQAALALKQGFGRLLRASSDRGVLALLDNRITRSSYGRVFLQSLPPYRLTNKLTDVRDFFHV